MAVSSKAQAALEYLTNYGWTVLIIIIVISAISYLVLRDSDSILPEKNPSQGDIYIADYTMHFYDRYNITFGHFKFILKSGQGKALYNVVLNLSQCEGGKGSLSDAITIGPDTGHLVTIMCEDIHAILYALNYFDVIIQYDTRIGSDTISHTKTERLRVTAQISKEFPDTNPGRKAWALENGASGSDDDNRFYPCKDVPGCNTPDPTGEIVKIFGGYVDSKTGKVWEEDDAPGSSYFWSEMNITTFRWDKVQPLWNSINENYDYYNDSLALAFKDDGLGTAFDYCLNLDKYGFDDWKLPKSEDFDSGIVNCNLCLPPLGTYAAPNTKFYWTEGYSGPPQAVGHAKCINFFQGSALYAHCTRSQNNYVRCIRDNP